MRRKQQRAIDPLRRASAMERATVGVPSETRDRYHDELVAEMHDLGRDRRVALRRRGRRLGLHDARRPDRRRPAARARRSTVPIGCRTNTRHVWKTTHTPDGQLYRACARCGKEYVPSRFTARLHRRLSRTPSPAGVVQREPKPLEADGALHDAAVEEDRRRRDVGCLVGGEEDDTARSPRARHAVRAGSPCRGLQLVGSALVAALIGVSTAPGADPDDADAVLARARRRRCG